VRLGAIPPPRSRNPRCPEALERAILKSLAIDPARRYQTASELHDDLMRFTVASGAVFGARQLATWLREEFRAEYENEQQRLRAWLAVGAPPSREPPRREPAIRSELPAVIVADLTQTPRAPVAAPADPHELPTIQVDDAALAESGQFDVGDDRTAAPRRMRNAALTRSLREQGTRANAGRWALYAAVPVALGVAAVSYVIGQREPVPGKVIVTPTPPVVADLIIDGRASGQLPPFVHMLSPGAHRIELRADGYKPFAATVQVAPGGAPVELNAKLEVERPLQVEGVVLTQAPAAAPPAPPPRNLPSSRKLQRAAPPAPPVEPLVSAPPPQLAAATPVVPPSIGYLVVQTKPATRLTIDGRDTGRWTPVPAAIRSRFRPGRTRSCSRAPTAGATRSRWRSRRERRRASSGRCRDSTDGERRHLADVQIVAVVREAVALEECVPLVALLGQHHLHPLAGERLGAPQRL